MEKLNFQQPLLQSKTFVFIVVSVENSCVAEYFSGKRDIFYSRFSDEWNGDLNILYYYK